MTYQAPLPYAIPTRVPGRGGLTAMGVISIVIGIGSACLSLATPFSVMAGRAAAARMPATGAVAAAPPDVRTAVVGFLLYAATAAAFGWVGAACLGGRRWVRPVVLAVAWPWLVMGVISLAFWLIVLPNTRLAMQGAMAKAMPPGAPPPPAIVVPIMLVGMSVMFALMGIGVPGLYLAFFARQRVGQTLAQLDGTPSSWTDAVPLPVLGLALWLWIAAASMVFVLVRPAVPVFGTFVTGLPAAVLILAMMALMVHAGRAVYAQRMSGWWITLALSIVGPAAYGVTVALRGLDAYYRALGMPESQIEATRQFGSGSMVAVSFVAPVLVLGYLVWVRRYFRQQPAASPVLPG